MHMHCSSGSRTSAQMRNSEVSKRANRFPFLTRSALDLCRFPKMALPPTIASLWRVAFRKFWRTRKKRFGGRRFPRGVPEKFLSHIWIRTFLVTGDRETMTRRHTLTTPSQKYLPYSRWLPGQINYTYIWSTKFIFYTCKLSISVAKIIITK
jgi:hypothetical protein